MKLINAKLCLDCDEVFEGNYCPRCGEGRGWHIELWLRPMREARKEAPRDETQSTN